MESKPTRKFKPKAPPRRDPKPEPKTENVEDVDSIQAMNLMRQFQERSLKSKPKTEKKVQASQIAFGFGAASNSIKSYGIPKLRSTGNQDTTSNAGATNTSSSKGKEYVEPWDYYSNYPVTLPMRRPYSGDPAILDEEEFGNDLEDNTHDENALNSALELGLMEENIEPSVLFLQLPSIMPLPKQSTQVNGEEEKQSLTTQQCAGGLPKACPLEELPAGVMGKLLVYKSGKVKLKLGDTLYDVSPSVNSTFAQDVVAINTEEKHCCAIGEIDKRAVLAPDVDAFISILSSLD